MENRSKGSNPLYWKYLISKCMCTHEELVPIQKDEILPDEMFKSTIKFEKKSLLVHIDLSVFRCSKCGKIEVINQL